MLKVALPINLSQQRKSKCGEIFFHSFTDFTIYCCFCNFKLFTFEDFLLHIQNVHFVNNLLKNQTITELCQQLTKKNVDNAITEVIEPKKELDRFESDALNDNNDNFEEALSIFEVAPKYKETSESEASYDDDFEDTGSYFEDDSSEESLLKVLNIKPEKIPWKGKQTKCTNSSKGTEGNVLADGLQLNQPQEEKTNESSSDESEKHCKEKDFACDECQKTFPRKKLLHQHVIELHNGYKCSVCDKRYRRQLQLRVHLQSHTTEKAHIYCPIAQCRRIFSNQKNLDRHLEVHTMECTFVCDIENCGKAFPTQRRLITHTYSHNKRNICDTCGYSCRSFATLVIHKRVHTGERPFPCEVCEKRFVSKTALSEHMIVHSSTRSHVCQICKATFTNFKYLQRHTLLHTTDRNYKCKLCDKAFKTPKGLKSHMRYNHSMLYVKPEKNSRKAKKQSKTGNDNECVEEEGHGAGVKKLYHKLPNEEATNAGSCDNSQQTHKDQEFGCAECKQIFESKEVFDKHILELHNGQQLQLCERLDNDTNETKNIPCPRLECRRTFASQKNLNRHLEVHTLDSTFVCDFENCGKAFPTKPRLIIHSRTHNKHNVCDICGYRCHAYATLVIHKRVHTGERPFTCNVCEKRFISKTGLLEHMSVHTITRSHVCQICKAAFTNFKSLRRHKLTHTNERNYKCKLCDKAFKTYNGLDNHMRCMHREPKSLNLPKDVDCTAKNFEEFTLKKIKKPENSVKKELKCKVCNKAFKRINGLDNHMRRFHGETDSSIAESYENSDKKKFKCNLCNKKFTSLTRHNLTHTDDRKFECQLCDNIFKTYNGLNSHIKRMHEDQDVGQVNKGISNAESSEELNRDLS